MYASVCRGKEIRFWWDLQLEDESRWPVCHRDGYLSVYPLAFHDYLSVDVLVFPSPVCTWCGMSHPLLPLSSSPTRKFLPKTICSSDYGGGSHTGPLLFALLIVRILPATSGEGGQIFGIFGPNFQFGVCRSAPRIFI